MHMSGAPLDLEQLTLQPFEAPDREEKSVDEQKCSFAQGICLDRRHFDRNG